VSVVSWPAGMLGVERPTCIRFGFGFGLGLGLGFGLGLGLGLRFGLGLGLGVGLGLGRGFGRRAVHLHQVVFVRLIEGVEHLVRVRVGVRVGKGVGVRVRVKVRVRVGVGSSWHSYTTPALLRHQAARPASPAFPAGAGHSAAARS
jgi:hypothetical protein